jgi:hypothetical protein
MVGEKMKILICGDRNYNDFEAMECYLAEFPITCDEPLFIISGGCRGADKLAERYCKKWKIPFKEYPADWDTYGKRAGPIRNRQMLDADPDIVIAFHQNLHKSKGTIDTIKEANKRGIEVRVVSQIERDPDE